MAAYIEQQDRLNKQRMTTIIMDTTTISSVNAYVRMSSAADNDNYRGRRLDDAADGRIAHDVNNITALDVVSLTRVRSSSNLTAISSCKQRRIAQPRSAATRDPRSLPIFVVLIASVHPVNVL